MGKRRFVVGVVAILVVMLIAGATGVATAGASVIYEDFSREQVVNPRAYDYLMTAHVDIVYFGEGSLGMIGETRASQDVDLIRTTILLQKQEGSGWMTVATDAETENNSNRARISKHTTAPTGYSYRLVGIHYIEHQGTVEEGITFSAPVYVF